MPQGLHHKMLQRARGSDEKSKGWAHIRQICLAVDIVLATIIGKKRRKET